MKKINIKTKYGNFNIEGLLIEYKVFITLSSDPKPAIVLFPPEKGIGKGMDTPLLDNLFNNFVNCDYSVIVFSFPHFEHNQMDFKQARNVALNCLDVFITEICEVSEKKITYFLVVGLSFGAVLALDVFFRRPEINGIAALSIPLSFYNCILSVHESRKDVIFITPENDVTLNQQLHNQFSDFLKQKGLKVKKIFFESKSHLFEDCNHKEIFNILKNFIDERSID